MYPFLRSTRADCLVAEISRRQKDSEQILLLRDVDSHNIVSSWCAQAKCKKLIESCCTLFQLKVFQKKELQAEIF